MFAGKAAICTSTYFILVHPLNMPNSNVVTVEDIVSEFVIPVHPSNADADIIITLLIEGNVRLVIPVHPLNAFTPIVDIYDKSTDPVILHPENALSLIYIKGNGMSNDPIIPVQLRNAPTPTVIIFYGRLIYPVILLFAKTLAAIYSIYPPGQRVGN